MNHVPVEGTASIDLKICQKWLKYPFEFIFWFFLWQALLPTRTLVQNILEHFCEKIKLFPKWLCSHWSQKSIFIVISKSVYCSNWTSEFLMAWEILPCMLFSSFFTFKHCWVALASAWWWHSENLHRTSLTLFSHQKGYFY